MGKRNRLAGIEMDATERLNRSFYVSDASFYSFLLSHIFLTDFNLIIELVTPTQQLPIAYRNGFLQEAGITGIKLNSSDMPTYISVIRSG